MKKAIIILIITIALLSLATWEAIAVNNIIKVMDENVQSIAVKYQDNKEDITILYDELDDIDNYWTTRESMLCLIFNHKDLSSITDSINKLKAYTQNNDYDNAISEVELLKGYTEKNTHIMGFNIHNIL